MVFWGVRYSGIYSSAESDLRIVFFPLGSAFERECIFRARGSSCESEGGWLNNWRGGVGSVVLVYR